MPGARPSTAGTRPETPCSFRSAGACVTSEHTWHRHFQTETERFEEKQEIIKIQQQHEAQRVPAKLVFRHPLEGRRPRGGRPKSGWAADGKLDMAQVARSNSETIHYQDKKLLTADELNAAVFNPDQTLFVVAGPDQRCVVYDCETGLSRVEFEAHEDSCDCVAFSCEGSTVFTGGADGKLRAWDVFCLDMNNHVDLQMLQDVPHPKAVKSIVTSPKSVPDPVVATGCADGHIRVYETCGWTNVFDMATKCSVDTLAFSPCGHQLASGGFDWMVRVWDWKAEASAAAIPSLYCAHAGKVSALAISPCGTKLASGSHDSKVVLWPAMHQLEGHSAWIRVLCFSEGGDTLASSCNELVCVWDTHTATLLNVFPAELNRIQTLKFDVDDGELLVGGVIDAEMLVEGISPAMFDPFVQDFLGPAPASKISKLSTAQAFARDGTPHPYSIMERPATR